MPIYEVAVTQMSTFYIAADTRPTQSEAAEIAAQYVADGHDNFVVECDETGAFVPPHAWMWDGAEWVRQS